MSKRQWFSLLAIVVGLAVGGPALANGVSVSIQVGVDPAVEYAGDGNTFFDEDSGVTFWWLTADPNNPVAGTGYEITG